MAKATTIKEALKKLEETRGVVAAELEKVRAVAVVVVVVVQAQGQQVQFGASRRVCNYAAAALADDAQVELYGQCPPIEKMDATLSTLKACKCAPVCWCPAHLLMAPARCRSTCQLGAGLAGASHGPNTLMPCDCPAACPHTQAPGAVHQ